MFANKKLVVSICILLLFCFIIPMFKATKPGDVLCFSTITLLLFQIRGV